MMEMMGQVVEVVEVMEVVVKMAVVVKVVKEVVELEWVRVEVEEEVVVDGEERKMRSNLSLREPKICP